MIAGDSTTFTIEGLFATPTGAGNSTLQLVDTLPKGLVYVEGSASIAPESVKAQSDGTTIITWAAQPTQSGKVTITYDATAKAAGNFKNVVKVTNTGTPSASRPELDSATADAVVSAQEVSETYLQKKVVSAEFAVNGGNEWDLTLTNKDASRTQSVWDVIDVLPYNGDGRGTSYKGTYTVGDVTAPEGAVVYYTDADPKTISAKPSDTSNGKMGDVEGNTVGWSTAKPAKVTAVRVIGTNLAPLASVDLTIPFTTSKNAAGDKYNNIATAQATLTELKMVKAEITSVAAEGSQLQIDKELIPGQALKPGGDLKYKIVVKNAGSGVANDVIVTDKGGDQLVAGSAVWSDLPQGTAEGAVWTVGNMQPGQELTATVTVTIDPKADVAKDVENAATVENPSNPPKDTCIPNAGVDADTDQCDVVTVKDDSLLKINKAAIDEKPKVSAGGTISYLIEGTNAGTTVAADVVITDLPKAGLDGNTIVELKAPSKGTLDAAKGVWTVGDLAPGEVVTVEVSLTVLPTVKPGDEVTNVAVIGNPVHPAPDGGSKCVSNDDLAGDTDQCDLVTVPVDPAPTTPPVTTPPPTTPPVTNPPVTNPPVTNPPVTNPPGLPDTGASNGADGIGVDGIGAGLITVLGALVAAAARRRTTS